MVSKGCPDWVEDVDRILVFDDAGQRLKPEPADLIKDRLIRILGDTAYLIVYNEEEGWSVMKMPVKETFEYARTHPLPPFDMTSF